jgi:hypothetical protein
MCKFFHDKGAANFLRRRKRREAGSDQRGVAAEDIAAKPGGGMAVASVGGAIAHSCLGHPSRAVELTLRKYDIVDGLDTVGKRGVVGCDD